MKKKSRFIQILRGKRLERLSMLLMIISVILLYTLQSEDKLKIVVNVVFASITVLMFANAIYFRVHERDEVFRWRAPKIDPIPYEGNMVVILTKENDPELKLAKIKDGKFFDGAKEIKEKDILTYKVIYSEEHKDFNF